jgi:uncharacterized coiled-coil protein SlyX
MGNLSNLYVSQSFQSLIHLGTNSTITSSLTTLQDGYGNSIGIEVNNAGDLFLSGSLTASLQQGHIYVGNASGKTSAFATSSLVTNINTGSLVTTSSFNSYTASNNQRVSSLEAATASLLIETQNLELFSASALVSISNLNASSASQQVSINALNAATSSYVTETESGSFLITASFDNGTRNLTFTKGNNTTFNVNIPDVSGSTINTGSFVTTSSFNSYTASTDSSISQLNASSASQQISINALNTFTQSQEGVNILLAGEIDSLQDKTGSYATTGSNNFIGNQNITGNITAFSASFTYLQTIFESSSVIYSSGSNQFGDELSDVQTLSGSVKVQGSLTVNGTPVLTSSVDISGLVTTSSFNAYTSSNNQRVTSLEANSASVNTSITNINSATSSLFTSASLGLTTASFAAGTLTFTKGNGTTFGVVIPDVSGSVGTTIVEVVYTGESITKGDPLYISGSQGANPRVFKADAADPNKMPVTFVSNETIGAANTTEAIVLGLIEGIDLTGYIAGQTIYVAEGGGWSASLPSGSNSVTQLLGVVTKGGNGGKGLVLNPGPAQLPGLDAGYLWVGGANNQPIEITTASFVSTASFNAYTSSTNQRVDSLESNSASVNVSISNLNSTTQSLNTSISNLNSTTASLNTSVSNLNASSASQQISIDALNVFTASQSTASIVNSITELNTFSASALVSISNLNTNSASVNTSITNINSATSSLFTSASLALVTASVSGTTLTFTKGDASTFNVTLPTGSGGGTIDTGSFATTGSNSFNGDQNITGSIRYSQQLLVGTTNLGPTIQALDSGTPSGFTGLQVNAGESGSFSMRTLYGGGVASATLEAYNTFPNPNSGGKISAKSGGGIDVFGYGADVTISGSNTTIQGLRYPNTDGTNGQVLTTNGSGILSFTTVSGSTINTGSLMVTGSVSGNVLTFTKGDASTFSLTVATGSGGGGSGSAFPFSGSAVITGSLSVSETIKSQVYINPQTLNGFTIPTGNNAMLVGPVAVSGSIVVEGNSNLIVLSQVTSSGTPNTGSLLVTASVNVNVITFTKGDASTFDLTVSASASAPAGTISGSSQITALGFATTGSNTFIGNQTITGSVSISGSSEFDLTIQGRALITGPITGETPQLIISGSDFNNTIGRTSVVIRGTNNVTSSLRSSGYDLTSGSNSVDLNLNTFSIIKEGLQTYRQEIFNNEGAIAFFIDGSGSYIQDYNPNVSDYANAIKFQPYSDYQRGQVTILKDLDVTGSVRMTGNLTASLQQGFVLVGDSNGRTTTVATSSFSGGTINTGSFATTGSNVFNGNQSITGSLSVTGSASVNGSQLVKSNQTGSFVTNIYNGGGGSVPLFFEYDLGNGGGSAVQLVAPTTLTGSVKISSGSQLTLPTGSNQQAGTAVLSGTIPATVVVSNSLVTANSIIMLTKQSNTTPASVSISSKGAGTFTIESTGANDADTVGWFIINNS